MWKSGCLFARKPAIFPVSIGNLPDGEPHFMVRLSSFIALISISNCIKIGLIYSIDPV